MKDRRDPLGRDKQVTPLRKNPPPQQTPTETVDARRLKIWKLLYSAMNTKTKTTMMIMAAALLCGIGNVCALPLRILIEEQHAKIEPAVKKFQQECSGHTDSQPCKEEHDALVKALDEFLSLVQNGLKLIDAHAGDASDADYQKQIEALRARAQQHLQWGQEQLKALAH
jgi:hypothetical protein